MKEIHGQLFIFAYFWTAVMLHKERLLHLPSAAFCLVPQEYKGAYIQLKVELLRIFDRPIVSAGKQPLCCFAEKQNRFSFF
jgi:hypothetical protein